MLAALVETLKEPRGLVCNGLALGYVVLGYTVGWLGLFSGNWILNGLGVLLLAHAMVIAAYLIHECAHNLVFRKHAYNARLGRALAWVCGSAYGTFEDVRYKHFRHHVDNDDVVWFDYEAFFERHPLLLRSIRGLEWLYIPAHDILMHVVMVFTSFVIPERRDQRRRNLLVIVLRGGLFVGVAWISLRVAVLYVLAYLLMLHVLRLMDSLQHDYPYNLTLFEYVTPPHKGDREWEQAHTFSNPLSLRYERLNWLTLNFGFHNAHHWDMNCPWYRLPALHAELTGGDPARVIPLAAQLRLYHRNRVLRVSNPQPEDYPKGPDYLTAARAARGSIGGNAASFLTAF